MVDTVFHQSLSSDCTTDHCLVRKMCEISIFQSSLVEENDIYFEICRAAAV